MSKLTPWRESQQPFDHSITKASQAHASEVYPNESVGFVVDGVYVPMENIHEDPLNHYTVDPKEVAKYASNLQGVIHSHPLENHPMHPSKHDMETQEAWGVPFGIQLINAAGPGNIIWFGDSLPIPEYEGRPYIYGVYDCYTILRDYYRAELDVNLPIVPRDDGFWNRGEEMYLDNTMAQGFEEIDVSDLQPNDGVLIKLKSKVANHAILYLGGDRGLHHMPFRSSSYDTVSKYINPSRAMFHSAWRYKGNKDE